MGGTLTPLCCYLRQRFPRVVQSYLRSVDTSDGRRALRFGLDGIDAWREPNVVPSLGALRLEGEGIAVGDGELPFLSAQVNEHPRQCSAEEKILSRRLSIRRDSPRLRPDGSQCRGCVSIDQRLRHPQLT
ncbi:MAG TPA: hypothetical protein VGM61_13485 [Pinirhizobacter sp.]